MKGKDYFWFKKRDGQTVFTVRDEKTGQEFPALYLVEYDPSKPHAECAHYLPVKLEPNLPLMIRRASIAIDKIGGSITDESLYSTLEDIVLAEPKEHPAA